MLAEFRNLFRTRGQFLIIKGKMQGMIWTIAGFYAPQTGKKIFSRNLIKKFEEMGEGNLILLGDFNGTMDDCLDRTTLGSSQIGIPKEF